MQSLDEVIVSLAMIAVGGGLSLFGYEIARLGSAFTSGAVFMYFTYFYVKAATRSTIVSLVVSFTVFVVVTGIAYAFFRELLSITGGVLAARTLWRLGYISSGWAFIGVALLLSMLMYVVSRLALIIALSGVGSLLVFLGLVRLGVGFVASGFLSLIVFVGGSLYQVKMDKR